MEITILIEPLPKGGFIARSGEPFAATAEGATVEEATRQLATALRARFQAGARAGVISLPNGRVTDDVDDELDDDWAFRIMLETIAENRRIENEANQRAGIFSIPTRFHCSSVGTPS